MYISKLIDHYRTSYAHYLLTHSFRQGKRVRKLNICSLARWTGEGEISSLQDALALRRKMLVTSDVVEIEAFDRQLVFFILDIHRAALGRSGQYLETTLNAYGEKINKNLEVELAVLRKRLEAALAIPKWRVGQSHSERPKKGTMNPAAIVKTLETRSRNLPITQPINLDKYQRNDLDNCDDSYVEEDEPATVKTSPIVLDEDDDDTTDDLPVYHEPIRRNIHAPTEIYYSQESTNSGWG